MSSMIVIWILFSVNCFPSFRALSACSLRYTSFASWLCTLNSSESIWPPPYSTGVYRNEEPSPEGQRDKEISFSQFILSLFEEVGRQLLPGNFACLPMCRPRLLAAGDSCCQKVLQSFSGSIQGDILGKLSENL